MKLDLMQRIFDKIEELGPDAASTFFGKSVSIVKKWQGGTAIPDVLAAQKVLDEALEAQEVEIPAFREPPPQGETKPPEKPVADVDPHTTEGSAEEQAKPMEPPAPAKIDKKSKKFGILVPTNRDFAPASVTALLGTWKATLPPEMLELLATLDIEYDTLLHQARNVCATRFLAGGHEWSFWMDSDMIVPIGNPAWFKRRTGAGYPDKWMAIKAIERLTSRGKSFIGGVYASRNLDKRLVAQPGYAPKDARDKKLCEEIRQKGPQDRVEKVDWVGFGCVAVHRKVFEDILKTQPEVAQPEGKPHGFFTPIEGGTSAEDQAFAKRAAKAGHPCHLDLSVFAAHIGRFAFLP